MADSDPGGAAPNGSQGNMMWSFGGIQDAMDSPGPRPRPEHAQTTVLWGCCRIITKRTASPKPAGEPGAPRLRGPQTPSAGKREDAFQSGQGPPPRTGSGLRSSCGPQPCQRIPTQASCQTAVPASAGCWTPQWPRTASGGGIGFTRPLYFTVGVPRHHAAAGPGGLQGDAALCCARRGSGRCSHPGRNPRE